LFLGENKLKNVFIQTMRKITPCIFLLFFVKTTKASESYPDTLNKKRMWISAGSQAAFYVAGLSFLQWVWYKDYEPVPFHYYNDNLGYLQMDKAGHAFTAYQQSYASYRSFRWAGMSRKNALLIGGSMGLIMQTPIEVFDGLYEGYGFSVGDMVANFAGSAIFTFQEAIYDRQIVQMKFSYSPSAYRQYHPYLLGETHLESFVLDYNGHTYWLSIPLKEVFRKSKIPDWLCFSYGYSANGMIGEFENKTHYRGTPIPHFERYRQHLFSFDIDLRKVKTKHKGLRKLFDAVSMLKFPAPTLEYNRIDSWKGRWVYF